MLMEQQKALAGSPVSANRRPVSWPVIRHRKGMQEPARRWLVWTEPHTPSVQTAECRVGVCVWRGTIEEVGATSRRHRNWPWGGFWDRCRRKITSPLIHTNPGKGSELFTDVLFLNKSEGHWMILTVVCKGMRNAHGTELNQTEIWTKTTVPPEPQKKITDKGCHEVCKLPCGTRLQH